MVRYRSGGALELVDVSGELPGLRRVPGLASWKLTDRQGNLYASPAEVKEDKKGRLVPSLFPPKEAAQLHLDRALEEENGGEWRSDRTNSPGSASCRITRTRAASSSPSFARPKSSTARIQLKKRKSLSDLISPVVLL